MSWSQNPYPYTPGPKQPSHNFNPNPISPYQPTVIKNQPKPVHNDTLKTPHLQPNPQPSAYPRRALVFLGSNKSKHMFPLYRDEEIGIVGEIQRKVHHSVHDDDKMTTTTQLGLAISQTCDDLYEVLEYKGARIEGEGQGIGCSFTQGSSSRHS